MVEEMTPSFEWYDTHEWSESAGSWQEQHNKVSEADSKRIEQSQKKAKQMGWFIAKKKQQNSRIAQFITFILQEVENDEIYTYTLSLFFKEHPASGSKIIASDMHALTFIWLFIPFYQSQAEEFGVLPPFKSFVHNTHSLSWYTQYVTTLLTKYYKPEPQKWETMVTLIKTIIIEFWLIDYAGMNKEQQDYFHGTLHQEFRHIFEHTAHKQSDKSVTKTQNNQQPTHTSTTNTSDQRKQIHPHHPTNHHG